SQGILEPLVDLRLSSIRYYEFSYGHIGDIKILLSRTGYTGEKGFELYFDAKAGPSVWSRLVESGVTVGKKLEPIGLAARDTLRLEMRYALYGNELSEEVTPLEAGLKWTVGFSKKNFIGKEAIEKQDRQGVLKKSIGFEMAGKGIPRSGYHIYCNGKKIGKVTSGTQSPSLGKGIGMGLVDAGVVNAGDTLSIEIRGKSVPAKVVRGAFVQSETGS
ncbi:MAG: glycine cleavage T C-terminal barrel domain-containing protein, partial [Nitrospinota bacterium]